MSDLNHLITLGLGSPAAIREFLTLGLQQGAVSHTEAPASRTYTPESETRTFEVPAETRTYEVD